MKPASSSLVLQMLFVSSTVSSVIAMGFHRIQELNLQKTSTSGIIEGVAIADYNGDGILDHVLCNSPFPSPPGVPTHPSGNYWQRLLIGTGNAALEDASEGSGLEGHTCSSVVSVDVDNDGDQDLITTLIPAPSGGCKVFLNDGTAHFSLVDDGFDQCPGFPGGFAVGDVDNDGYVDVYVPSINVPFPDAPLIESIMFLGDGAGHFNTLVNSGAELTEYPCDASFMDLDDDGDTDLLVLGCNKFTGGIGPVATPLYMFRNMYVDTGVPSFQEASDDYGVGLRNGYWMSTAFGDINGDGHLDVYVGNIGCEVDLVDGDLCQEVKKHAVLLNNADGTYTDVAEEAGIAVERFNWGSAFIDIENDGTQDLVTVGNTIGDADFLSKLLTDPDIAVYSPGAVFKNNHNSLPFELIEEFGIRTGSGLAVGDVDNDGLEDILIQKSGYVDGAGVVVEDGDAVLLLNTNAEGNGWLKVRLEGTTSNRDAIGAKVVLTWSSRKCVHVEGIHSLRCTRDTHKQARAVLAGSSAFSSHDKVITFGIGDRPIIYSIRVQWPDGHIQSVNRAYLIRPNTLVHVVQD